MDFHDKTILITGASAGIGKALAEKLSDTRCKIFFIARRKELLNVISESLSESNAELHPIGCDTSSKDEVCKVYSEIASISNGIDVAILNAGVSFRTSIEEFNSELAETTFSTNFFGAVYWIENLLPDYMRKRKGIIALVSSLADNRGYSGSGFYCASKGALSILGEGLRSELHNYGIKVITVKPGFVKTPMTDKNDFKMPFMIDAGKAADIIIKGIRKEKDIISFPMITSLSSKLIGCMPSLIYHFLERNFFKK